MSLHAIEDEHELDAPVVHNAAAEHAVIASCIDSQVARAEAAKHITGADFYEPRYELLWDAIHRLAGHGKAVDFVTLNAVLETDATRLGEYARRTLIDLISTPHTSPDDIATHAAIVRSWALKRRLADEATRVRQQAMSPSTNVDGLAAAVVNRFAAIRDAGLGADEIAALTLEELLDLPDEPYDWIIPGLLERGDRLMVTGEEGLGKSSLLRQIAILGAAGVHPFLTSRRIQPIKALIYDAENSRRQFVRKARELHTFACINGDNPGPRVMVENVGRINITRDKDLAKIHALCDAMQPDILVIGPLYRLVPHAVNTDDEASPLLAALDTIKDRGIALLIEAHAGKSTAEHGGRNMAPRGSSALLGWPEFGYGMRKIDPAMPDYCDFIPWRGARDERAWPSRMKRAGHMTWMEVT